MDELEAIRLRNYEGLYQEKAAEKMKILRQTFGRLLESANKKIAEAMINGVEKYQLIPRFITGSASYQQQGHCALIDISDC